jgi:hypothetical protein
MKNKKYWLDEFSKIYNDVKIIRVHYFVVLTDKIRKKHNITSKKDKSFYVICYSFTFTDENGVKSTTERRWIQSNLKKERKMKLNEIFSNVV